MENKIKRIILIGIIILLIIVVWLLILLRKENKVNSSNETIEETPVDYYNTYQAQRASEGVTANSAVAHLEDNANQYYTIKSILDSFSTYITYLNATVKDLGIIVSKDKEAEALDEYKQDGLTYINDMLADNYKTKYSVNDNYIYNLLKNYVGKKYKITDMYVLEDSDYINTYFIYGNYSGEEFDYIVILDRYNYTFEIYLDNYFKENNYSRDKVSSMTTLHIDSIDANDNNIFQYKNINKEELAVDYFNEYLDLMINDTQSAYELLDLEYKAKRFGDFSAFKNYVSEVIDTENVRSAVNYSYMKHDDYIEYVCQDIWGNNYIFKSTGIMKYTVILDAYTVPVDLYEKEYESANNTQKAQLCLNRFFECINNKDYEKAYSYLNSSYKENNFPTLNEFETYVKSNWYDINSFTYSDIQLDNETYILYGEVGDFTTQGSYNSECFSKSFALKLGSDIRDFEISFVK